MFNELSYINKFHACIAINLDNDWYLNGVNATY